MFLYSRNRLRAIRAFNIDTPFEGHIGRYSTVNYYWEIRKSFEDMPIFKSTLMKSNKTVTPLSSPSNIIWYKMDKYHGPKERWKISFILRDGKKGSCRTDMWPYQRWYQNQPWGIRSDATLSPSPEPADSIPLADELMVQQTLYLLKDCFLGQCMNLGEFSIDIFRWVSGYVFCPASVLTHSAFYTCVVPSAVFKFSVICGIRDSSFETWL